MLTKAAYVVWVSSALKLRKGKKVSVPPFQLSSFTHLILHLFFLHQPHSVSLSLTLSLKFPFPTSPSQCFYSNKAVIPSFRLHRLVYWVGGGSKILCCCCGGRVEYNGMILISPTSGPRSSTSLLIRLQASSISWKTESAALNGGISRCMQAVKANRFWKTPGETMVVRVDDSGRRRGGGRENRGSLLQYICSNYRSIWRRKLNLDCSMLCWAPCGSVVKCSNHGKHGRARYAGTHTHTHTHRARQTQTGFIIPQCSIVEGNVRWDCSTDA